METAIIDRVRTLFPELEKRDPFMLNPLVLAYVGDTIYDLLVRTWLIEKYDYTVHGLHVLAAGIVKASAQADALDHIQNMLTEDEMSVYRRARNSKIGTLPKHAELQSYLRATGLEAVLGYLYLTGRDDRLIELAHTALMDKLEQHTEE
jgi:ribonuclease-3 family protein